MGLPRYRRLHSTRNRDAAADWRSVQAAEVKGRLDIAIVSLMRDALLRVSEEAALTWGDIEADPGG